MQAICTTLAWAGAVAGIVLFVRAPLFQGVRDYLLAHRPEIVCGLPLVALLFTGSATPGWVYGLLVALFGFLVLITNPLAIWDRLLPPKTRALIAAGILVALLPLTFDTADVAARLSLWAIAAVLVAAGLWRRRAWLALWRVQQSPDVDTVLAHLSHDGDWEAGNAWTRYGCRETRALLHQTLWAECDEGQITRTYMPCYLLGYLHGKGAEGKRRRKAEQQAAEAAIQARTAQLEQTVQQQAEQLTALQQELADARRKLDRAEYEAVDNRIKANVAQDRLERRELPQQQRDEDILTYYEAGHSYAETGKRYGLTKGGALAAANRARARREEETKP